MTTNVKDWRWCDRCRKWVWDWRLLRIGLKATCSPCLVAWNRAPLEREELKAAEREAFVYSMADAAQVML